MAILSNLVKTIVIFSILALFVLVSGVSIMPSAFADHATASVSSPEGTSVPGCEETDECFIPSTVTIDVGGEVTWTNDDSAAHTVTSGTATDGPDGFFDSSLFMAGDTFSVKFDGYEPGEYPYFCMVHPWMVGTVIVQAAGEEMEEEEHMEMEDTMDDKMMMKTMMIGGIDVTMSPPLEGSDDASVTIIEFGDFQCPKCDQWFQNEKSTVKSDYLDTGKANLYFVDFTFLGDDSISAAQASYCANEQGKYWEYHAHLYNNQGGINEGWASVDNLKQFASEVGLDTMKFNACLDSGKYADRVSHNTSVGSSHGVEGTPAFFIVGPDGAVERIDGPQPAAIFASTIDSMLGEAMAQEMEDDTMEEEATEADMEEGGGCLIATATFGSELAPQVQMLREVRDNSLLQTQSGQSFMQGFNEFYYSFSPTIADWERENPVFKETVKVAITPLVTSLSILNYVEIDSEIDMIGYGVSLILLNVGMYFVAPAIMISKMRKIACNFKS